MDISPEGVYNRMVVERSGGSYCFGLNTLLFQMLRILRYRAYTGAARINIEKDILLPPKFTAPLHMVIFVQLYKDSNVTYLVDVGCGGSGPTRPILLSDAEDNTVIGTSPSEKHHLTKGAHPKTSLAVQSHNEFNVVCTDWQLEVLHENMDSMIPPSWRIVYSFSEKEWFSADFDSANLAVCAMQSYNSPLAPWQRHLGRLAMDRSAVRRHVGSRSEVLRTFTTERERILALRELFGVHTPDDDVKHILGRAAALSET
ncbi:hypothetical protein M422DRAFT_252932 [Sphaerobolus stellatus SS14]|uniref:Uncharacterized protein n=1 Tax=Sphaerobolus stellatus (strain SS14) TaxID=990650 RepID=A0A0C9V9N4_SPHS4|nr:hypothetical protein M422DRAFT_252932 [Sphaerobolus stellatus SS14]